MAVRSWQTVELLLRKLMPPLPTRNVFAAGHNSRLQKAALSFLLGRGCRQPWLRFHCTAGACCGIMMGVAVLAFAAAAETKR